MQNTKKEIQYLMQKALCRRIKALQYNIKAIAQHEADLIRGLWRKYNKAP